MIFIYNSAESPLSQQALEIKDHTKVNLAYASAFIKSGHEATGRL